VRLHVPSLPSLKDRATGVLGSLTIVAQEANRNDDKIAKIHFFIKITYYNLN
jgi:hypothetical protein